LVSPTRSDSLRRSGNARAGWSVAVGLASVAVMPLAILATRYSSAYHLLDAGFAIPLGLLLGVGALLLARSGSRRNERSLGRLGGETALRWGRVLATIGLSLTMTALISVSVYGLLEYLGSRD
jgi:hypothetical protein